MLHVSKSNRESGRKEQRKMKYKTTKKEMKENYYNILSVGYCNLQYLLRHKAANSYCSSIYGWYCDNYELTGSKRILLLSTGYNPIKSKNINKNDEEIEKIIKKYENKAEKIRYTKGNTCQQIEKKLHNLLIKFVDEVLESEDQE